MTIGSLALATCGSTIVESSSQSSASNSMLSLNSENCYIQTEIENVSCIKKPGISEAINNNQLGTITSEPVTVEEGSETLSQGLSANAKSQEFDTRNQEKFDSTKAKEFINHSPYIQASEMVVADDKIRTDQYVEQHTLIDTTIPGDCPRSFFTASLKRESHELEIPINISFKKRRIYSELDLLDEGALENAGCQCCEVEEQINLAGTENARSNHTNYFEDQNLENNRNEDEGQDESESDSDEGEEEEDDDDDDDEEADEYYTEEEDSYLIDNSFSDESDDYILVPPSPIYRSHPLPKDSHPSRPLLKKQPPNSSKEDLPVVKEIGTRLGFYTLDELKKKLNEKNIVVDFNINEDDVDSAAKDDIKDEAYGSDNEKTLDDEALEQFESVASRRRSRLRGGQGSQKSVKWAPILEW